LVTRIFEISAQNLLHNWHYLFVGAILAAAIQVFVPSESISKRFDRAPGVAILAATATGALTPLCSCGSVAVMLSLVAAGVPWSPIAAFLVSSPLMSPSMYLLTAGHLGLAFANAKLLAAVVMGLIAGHGVLWVERRRELRCTSRDASTAAAPCGCGATKTPALQVPETPSCGSGTSKPPAAPHLLRRLARETWRQSAFILKYFVVFVVIGSALQVLAPPSLVQALVGANRAYAVPLAAILGTPLYVSGIGAIPLMASLVKIGMSRGAALAFTISGAGTSVGALAAVIAVAPRRVFWVYLLVMFAGAIAAGYVFSYVVAG
jgi:uncharacterized membrane protein YraQ (UPF0718 family)